MVARKNVFITALVILMVLLMFKIYAKDKTEPKQASLKEQVKEYFSSDSRVRIDKEIVEISGTEVANASSTYIKESWGSIKNNVDINYKISGLIKSGPKQLLPLAITWAGLIEGDDDDDPYRFRDKALSFIFFYSDRALLENNKPDLIKLFSNSAMTRDRNINLKELIMWSFLDDGINAGIISKTALAIAHNGDNKSANKIISVLKDGGKKESLSQRIFLCSSAMFVKNREILNNYLVLLSDETPAREAGPSGIGRHQRVCDLCVIHLSKRLNLEELLKGTDDLHIFSPSEIDTARQMISKKIKEVNGGNHEDTQPPKDK